ncbi:hypothetical protein NDU88_011680 [Pleurodeles waltl]|uniref:Uncharacterized protein n=1 Tax=Pleurodeles waltl TaxID=8319 RepID=A0AAV7S5M6_PLEWA|nr:hypothetical protein NDU88_011680 [Pleurodeles waltl]
MSGSDVDGVAIPEGKTIEELIKTLTQSEIKTCIQETIEKVMDETKRKAGSENEIWSLSEEDTDQFVKQGKRKRKSKHLNGESGGSGRLVCQNTKRMRCVLSNTQQKKGVLSGTNRNDNLGGSKEMNSQSDEANSESISEKKEDKFNEYGLDLDIAEGDKDEWLQMDEGPSTLKDVIKYPLGEEMFSPYEIRHPRSEDWWLLDHVAQFIMKWTRTLLDEEVRNIMRAENSRPVLEGKAGVTLNLDPE